MRLDKIKLAGFKSFVDPTTIPFPSNLVGVVGPNGCGKSNVIDAVRWVMGESSAKMLRGESMADVIFNGSNARKPVGVASVELVFDNSEGRAGGQYAKFSSISVRRQVSREGQSQYFLNGVRCRRRDITDLFLGTGLGSRSYAIIEQGMISRIIESRPEELRVYLEEAAGISKYKERRRETENRIRHTRENLERLTDLRDEIATQLKRLQRQAETAEKYKNYRVEERQLKAELLLLRLRQMEAELASREALIDQRQQDFQAAAEALRDLEQRIEQGRERHQQANESFNSVQGRYYAAGADIARLEEALQYAQESRSRLQSEQQRAQAALAEAQRNRSQDEDKLQQMAQSLQQDQPELERARERAEQLAEQETAAQQAMHDWQQEWDAFNLKATEPAQTAQLERAAINRLEQQQERFKQRLQRLEQEHQKLAHLQLQAEINELEEREQQQAQVLEERAASLEDLHAAIEQGRSQIEANQQQLAQARSELETGQGRLASLQALQQAALGEDDKDFARWCRQQGLHAAPRLLEQVQAEERWQAAVEAALGYRLQALLVDRLDDWVEAVTALSQGRLNLFEKAVSEPAPVAGSLAEKVQGPAALRQLLNGIHCAEDLQQALQQREQLQPGEFFVTPEGVCLGRGWLQREQGDASAGMLAREGEIRRLQQRLQALTPLVETLEQDLKQQRQQLSEQERQRNQLQQESNQANKALAQIQSQLGAKRTRAEHLRERAEALTQEMEEIRQQFETDQLEMEAARERLHQALEQMEIFSVQREQLAARRERLQNELADAREAARQARAEAHDIALRVEAARSSEQSLRGAIERMEEQLQQARQRCEQIQEQLLESEQPLQQQQQELQQRLEQRAAIDAELQQARAQLQKIDGELRELERQRHQAEQKLQQQRELLDHARLARQEVKVRIITLDEQLQQSGMARSELEAQLPEQARIEEWEQRAEKLARRIQQLGAINLAAIDEFKEQSERLEFIDTQHADVTQSLETLEAAIAKIDKETRARFSETFDKVNSGLQDMFPKLFGGGRAYLEMVGEDALSAGVAIMARPPGKRNSSIHLLSGGEKALSAVALVFAIFQLNPAPFCMLDEVDAPLDDANVGRFCELVKEMSHKVQFVFITHNKVTMALANQLLGVTMNEPGVSRLVSVDVDEAVQLANA